MTWARIGQDFSQEPRTLDVVVLTGSAGDDADNVRLIEGFEIAQQLCLKTIPSLNDSRGTEIVAIVAVMTVVSTVAVILRLMGRKISAAPYGIDDALIIVALVLTYGLNINEIIAVHYGFGRHQLMLSLDHIKKFLLNDWTIQILFATAISVTRMSLLVFYHRLFPVRRFTIIAVITGCFMVGWWISFIFAIVFSCKPVASFWNKAIIGHCLNEHSLSWGITGSELGANIIMLVLPIPWLLDLRLAFSKKLALIGIFMLGCFVCLSCIVRFPLLAAVVQTDASWTIVPAGVWIAVECNIGIASVCLPLMRPLVNFEFSNLSTYFSFTRSRRTASPFSDEEAATESSSGLRSVGQLCEKSDDEPCPAPVIARHPRNGSSSFPETKHQHLSSDSSRHHPRHRPSKPIYHDRGYRDVHTHRSRIESYSPDTPQPDYLKVDPLPNPKETRSSALPYPKSAPKAHPPPNPKEMRSSAPPGPINATVAPPPPNPKATRSSAPPASRNAAPKPLRPETAIFNPLQAHPPSVQKTPRYQSQSDPLKPRPASAHKPQSPRHRSAPVTLPNQKPPRYRSAPVPTSAYNPHRRKARRLTADEMNERWRLWYQGRGSEVGRGLWSLEIKTSPRLNEGRGGPGGKGERKGPWEVGEGEGWAC